MIPLEGAAIHIYARTDYNNTPWVGRLRDRVGLLGVPGPSFSDFGSFDLLAGPYNPQTL